jgi:predicted O-methyltransferase YrrM
LVEENIMGKFNGTFRDTPWLGVDAIAKLDSILKPESMVLECGSGASTLWIAPKVTRLCSYEHNPKWVQAVELELERRNITNVDLCHDADYPKTGIKFAKDLFDIVIIDGRGRNKGIETGFPLVKPGGYLILDNSNRARYQPANDLMSALKWECEIIQSPILPKNQKGYTTFWRRPK